MTIDRENRSATTPPTSMKTTIGMVRAAITTPRALAEPVRSRTANVMAIGAITEPVVEMSRPVKYQANLASARGLNESGRCGRLIPGLHPFPRPSWQSAANCGKRRLNSGVSTPPFPQFAATAEAGHNGGMTVRYHLNADVGEGFDTDAELLALVTQANVACGFHAGDEPTMRAVCELAVAHDVQVGAQPSYRDRENFGRADVEIGYADLVRDLTNSWRHLQAVAREAGTEVTYLKPHGALYNRIVHDADQAKAVVDVALQLGLPLMTLPGSAGAPPGRGQRRARDQGVLRRPRLRQPRAGWCRARSKDPSSPTPRLSASASVSCSPPRP